MESERSDADIMADAREYIEENGWWRGALVGPNGRQVCGMGAVAASQGWLLGIPEKREVAPLKSGLVTRILAKVMAAIGRSSHEFISWNDNLAKDKQEVLDAFAKAEKIERAGFDPDA